MDTNRTVTINKEKHEFALFVESLSLLLQSVAIDQIFIITDEVLFHRIKIVLRLHVDECCILFDRSIYAVCTIVAFTGKKQIHVKVQSKHSTIILNPLITFFLPLLKKDDYEQALYSLAEIGVNEIQLIYTKKTGASWSERDFNRAQRILIAAAEQSKNYCYPVLKTPVFLDEALHNIEKNTTKIFFDPTGEHCFSVMRMLHEGQPTNIVLLIGPEGDLSNQEKEIVKEKGFIFCALTPTVVRALQATALGAGLVRSLMTKLSV